jgi:fluoroquinolone resistance protein
MTDIQDEETVYLSKQLCELDYSSQTIQAKEFDNCTFRGCNFSETSFDRCKFVDCHFVQCNLSNINIDGCRFSDVTFEESKMIGVNWTKASWPGIVLHSPIKFYKCILNDSSFFGTHLQELMIEDCKAHDVDFREANLSEAVFTLTDFSSSLFNNTNLTYADFTDANNYTIDIYNNDIKGAKFCRVEAVSLLESLDIELVD